MAPTSGPSGGRDEDGQHVVVDHGDRAVPQVGVRQAAHRAQAGLLELERDLQRRAHGQAAPADQRVARRAEGRGRLVDPGLLLDQPGDLARDPRDVGVQRGRCPGPARCRARPSPPAGTGRTWWRGRRARARPRSCSGRSAVRSSGEPGTLATATVAAPRRAAHCWVATISSVAPDCDTLTTRVSSRSSSAPRPSGPVVRGQAGGGHRAADAGVRAEQVAAVDGGVVAGAAGHEHHVPPPGEQAAQVLAQRQQRLEGGGDRLRAARRSRGPCGSAARRPRGPLTRRPRPGRAPPRRPR